MDGITLKAHAKINLSLDVVGKKENGYHLLRMVMQEISLYDTVSVSKIEGTAIKISSSASFLPVGKENIAYRACEIMREAYGLTGGYGIHIEKRIPVAAGLAGGSTDAAAVMKAIRTLENLEVTDAELMTLSLKIGSDIPFCIQGGTALAEGIGDLITPLNGGSNYWILLIKPSLSVSTQHVYKALQWDSISHHPKTDDLIQVLPTANLHQIAPLMGNVLESVTAKEHAIIQTIKHQLMTYGAVTSQMSGSGPTVFGLFKRDDQAKSALKNMKRFYQQAYLVRPVMRRV